MIFFYNNIKNYFIIPKFINMKYVKNAIIDEESSELILRMHNGDELKIKKYDDKEEIKEKNVLFDVLKVYFVASLIIYVNSF
jgi:hypothetical protein